MYRSFYGLNEKPFSLTPDTKFLYLSKNHQDATNHLLYGIREKEGFVVLTGDIGTGKTTIVRALLERLGRDTSSALVLSPTLEGEELLRCILEEFGIDNKGAAKKELIDRLNRFLLGELMHERSAVLIIDEAQHLSEQALEEIRLLSNLETEKAKLLQIILVGQIELHQKLESSLLRPLNQRISIRYHLLPLSRIDTEKYIYHRLLVAGANGHISFAAGALNLTFKHSRGIPRLINLVCDRTLLAGYAGQSNYLDKKMVKRAVEVLGKQGVSSGTASKGRKIVSLGVLALLLGSFCIILFQGEAPYAIASKITHFIRQRHPVTGPPSPVTGPTYYPIIRPPSPVTGPTYPVIRPPSPVTPTDETESTTTSTQAGKSSPGALVSEGIRRPYSIHTSSYRDNRQALMDVNQFRKLKYHALVYKVDIPGKGIWYRVMLAEFRIKGDAQEMLKKIKKRKGFSDARIIKLKGDKQ